MDLIHGASYSTTFSCNSQVAATVKSSKYPFVMCNFAPPDMVGHTGVYDATVKACEATGMWCVWFL